jgi:hypothetical protein
MTVLSLIAVVLFVMTNDDGPEPDRGSLVRHDE